MDYGAHLPLVNFASTRYALNDLRRYTATARELGFSLLAVNDHLSFTRPWLDGATALSAVLSEAEGMTVATTVALPVVRGPVALAKSLAAIDLLSAGRLIVGVGAGSSARDFAAVGVPFEERWKRLEETIQIMRSLWQGASATFAGKYYRLDNLTLEPFPARRGGPPVWIGSWGSEAGLRRTARLGDGWLASAYNTTPDMFACSRRKLGEYLGRAGKDDRAFPNALATMFLFVTEDRRRAERVLQDILAPALNRPEYVLRERLLIGPAEECAQRLAAYQAAGAQRVLLWPVADELAQLETFLVRVAPLVHGMHSQDVAL